MAASADELTVGERPAGRWLADDLLIVGDTEFAVTPDADRYLSEQSTATRFVVAKTRPMVERLAATIGALEPRRVVELGIFKGGSAALLAALAEPVRLTAIELATTPVDALAQHIERRGLTDVIRPHYGVDQGDRDRLAELLDSDHGSEPIDLVVDDASHYYRETRASFELLFARMRPGGRYIIEDWGWAHYAESLWQAGGGPFHDRPALSNLVVELLMIAVSAEDLVAHVEVFRDTVTVTRGPLAIADPIRLEDHYRNRGLPFRPLL